MQLFVVGMHRSGTSGITRVLNMAGAYFGPEGMSNGADEGNPKGFWERLDIRAMCDGFLQDSGFDWWKVADFSVDAIPTDVRDEHLATWNKLLLEIDAHRPWVIKEPRISLLFPLIRPTLEVPICIHVTREPLEVAGSLRTRNGIPTHAGLALWERYTIDAFASTAGLPRVHVRYEDLMAAPTEAVPALIEQLAQLGAYGLRVPSDKEITSFITPKLHRQHRSPDERLAWMNEQQLALATAIDQGTILDIDMPDAISPSALAVLREFESDREEMARLEGRQADTEAEVESLQDRIEAEATAFGERIEDLEARTDRFQARADDAEQRAARLETRSEAAESKATRHEAAHRSERERRQRVEHLALEGLRAAEKRLDAAARSRTWKLAWRAASMRQALTPGVKRRRGPVDSALRTVRHTRSQIEKAGDDSKEPPPAGSPAAGSNTPTVPATPIRHRGGPGPDTRSGSASRPKVAVVSWDVGHNPLGRAHVLASILDRRFDVEVWGAQFPRYGTDVWEPLRHGDIPVRVFPGVDLPDHLDTMATAVREIDADAIYVSKPRFPSYALGAMAKQFRNRPLVLDVDDHELAFFDEDQGLTVDQLRDIDDEDDLRLAFGHRWTQACEPLISAADHVTVSNVALQDRFGGTIVPHARDERRFDPARYDRDETRRALGIPLRERLLLFGGTPRRHKGIVEVLQALDRLGDDRYRVLIFGTREFNTLRKEIGSLSRWVRALPPLDFADLPRMVGAADLACVLQDPSHPISRYQLPAKLTDALAMGVPTLVRPVPPLRALVDKGALQVLAEGERLHQRIADIFDDYEAAREVAADGRRLFTEAYSYEAVGQTINPLFEELIDGPTEPLHPGLTELIEAPREIVTVVDAGSSDDAARKVARPVRVPGRRLAEVPEGAQFDVVMIWKQNDSGIYGRRSDMMLEYLSRSDRVHRIVHFDRPITPEELRRTWRSANPTIDQRRQTVQQTIRRALHRADSPGVRNRTFLYGGKYTKRLGLPQRRSFADHVQATLQRSGFGSRPVVLVTYPTNPHLPAIIDTLDPEVVVTDVVDDHRTFCEPGTERYADFEQNYREVLTRSDVVVANCEAVASGMREFAPQVHIIPNGCELTNGELATTVPEELRHIRGPIIGYAGNLSQRLDLDLLEKLVRAHPEWHFVFVGSAHYDRSILDLEHQPNVTFTGPKPYEDTVRLVQHFDVALIPHLDDRMTRSMNPLKAFVYVSTGVPVVSTPIANLDELGDLIHIARGADGFAAAITEALARGRHEPDLDRLTPISWPARVERLIELIDEAASAARSA